MALRIISALPDCSSVLYCCQAYRITCECSAPSRSTHALRNKRNYVGLFACLAKVGHRTHSDTSGCVNAGGTGESRGAELSRAAAHACRV